MTVHAPPVDAPPLGALPVAELSAGDWPTADVAWSLHLDGGQLGQHARWPPLPGHLRSGSRVLIDGQGLARWDAALAADLWSLRNELAGRGALVHLVALPAGLLDMLALATTAAAAPALSATAVGAPNRPATPGIAPAATATTPATPRPPRDAAITVAFFGEVLIALWRWLCGRSSLRAADVLHQLDQTGPRSLPIVLLTCALIGLMLAYMGGAQLGRIGAQGFLADVVTVGMVRELAGLMAGVILAGRLGAAFAAQLASMQAGDEIDALRVLGVDPITHLVLPRLLALLLIAPALIVFGALAGVAAGWPAAVWGYGVSSSEYWHQCQRALTATHLWIGLFKGLLYVALLALAGCREGLHAGRSAQAVGAATTTAVVKALVWIVVAACTTTVAFTALGF